jgi:hypothetical protein
MRFIANVLVMVIVLLVGAAMFDIDPSVPEMLLVGTAWIVGDFFEALIFGERR